MWSKESLRELVQQKLRDYLFIVVSNREPYVHTYAGSEIRCEVPASGLTVALDPVMRAWQRHPGRCSTQADTSVPIWV